MHSIHHDIPQLTPSVEFMHTTTMITHFARPRPNVSLSQRFVRRQTETSSRIRDYETQLSQRRHELEAEKQMKQVSTFNACPWILPPSFSCCALIVLHRT